MWKFIKSLFTSNQSKYSEYDELVTRYYNVRDDIDDLKDKKVTLLNLKELTGILQERYRYYDERAQLTLDRIESDSAPTTEDREILEARFMMWSKLRDEVETNLRLIKTQIIAEI
mgnify:FL=1